MGILRLLTLPFRLVSLLAFAVVLIAAIWIWQETRAADGASFTDARADLGAEAPTADPIDGRRPFAGVWSWEQDGTERPSALGLSVTRRLPDRAPMIVRHTPRGFEMELRLSDGRTESWRLDRAPNGWFLSRRRSEAGAFGLRSVRDDRLRPAPLWLPDERSGTPTWRAAGTRGSTGFLARGAILSRKIVRIDGEPVSTVVLRRRIETRGVASETMVETWWWAPSRALPVRMSLSGSQDAGSLMFTTETSLRLADLRPVQ